MNVGMIDAPAMEIENVDVDLREIDEKILDELEQGRCTRRYLAEELEVTGEYVYQRVDLLIKLGLVHKIHDGFYELAEDAPVRDREEQKPSPEVEPEPVEMSEPEPEPAQLGDETIDDVISVWRPGQGSHEREEIREEGRRALEWLKEQNGPRTKAEMIEALHDNGIKEDSWWRRRIRPCLQKGQDLGVLTWSRGGGYEWIV